VSDREIQALGRFFQKYNVELMLAEKVCWEIYAFSGYRVTSIPEPSRPEDIIGEVQRVGRAIKRLAGK